MKSLPGSLLALALVVAGCGSDSGSGGSAGTETESPASSPTSLEILVWPEGEGQGEPQRYTLSCDPPSGNHPDPPAACAALESLGAKAFAPVPPDMLCTQIYGGPGQAQVRGTVAGEEVDARLAYNDGCQIARWNKLRDVVPGAGGTGR